ncbi:MAG TPA: hypothetical protein EYN66_07940 [Myxococcales bacterium]|nr:hypothetical protein [Myxococcales bacterium]
MSNDDDDRRLEPTAVQDRLIRTRDELLHKVWGETPALFNHAVLCSVGLPYRNLGDDVRTFQRTSGTTSLQLQAGAIPNHEGGFDNIGLPFGPRARLLLLHLCSQAVREQSPVIEVQDSFTAFARELGLATTGRNLRTLRDQVNRMSVVSMRLARRHATFTDMFQGHVFSKLRAEYPNDPNQLPLWTSIVEFSPEFYASLITHAVPMRLEAIAALKHSARALDLYCWLSHRLWRVKPNKPVDLSWYVLRDQFGTEGQNIKSFKRAFVSALRQVLVVYPEAKVLEIKGGLKIQESPPPVPFSKPALFAPRGGAAR